MLVPAILYKEEIQLKIQEYNYTESMLYYTGYLGHSSPRIEASDDGNFYQYAIVTREGRLIGYFAYTVDWYSSCVYNFGLFSFDKNNRQIGLDIYKELKKLINDYHLHRVEFRMVSGNSVERHYDKFCQKYHGRKIILTDVLKDRYGKYHNEVIYEIIFKGVNKDGEKKSGN